MVWKERETFNSSPESTNRIELGGGALVMRCDAPALSTWRHVFYLAMFPRTAFILSASQRDAFRTAEDHTPDVQAKNGR